MEFDRSAVTDLGWSEIVEPGEVDTIGELIGLSVALLFAPSIIGVIECRER